MSEEQVNKQVESRLDSFSLKIAAIKEDMESQS